MLMDAKHARLVDIGASSFLHEITTAANIHVQLQLKAGIPFTD